MDEQLQKSLEFIQRVRQSIQKGSDVSQAHAGEVFKRIDNIRRHTANLTSYKKPDEQSKGDKSTTPTKSKGIGVSSAKKEEGQWSEFITKRPIQPKTTLNPQLIALDNIKERFATIKCLGRGKTGDCFIAQDRITNQLVALKIIQKSTIQSLGLLDLLVQEIKIQYSLNHHNIVKLFGVLQDDKKVVLVQEMCTSNLYGRQVQKYEEYVQLIYQVCSGLEYMHQRNIIHRDIKLENVLLLNDQAKICDLGLAMHCPGLTYGLVRLKGLCGTPGYMAPEVASDGDYGLKADAYSLGVLAYELYFGHLPDEDYEEELTKMPKQLQDFVLRLLNKDEYKRMSVREALNHQMFKTQSRQSTINLPVVNMVSYTAEKILRM